MLLHRSFPGATGFSTFVAALLSVLLAAGCGNPSAAPEPAAAATISALATSNAQLTTQVAELAAAAGAATPAPAALPEQAVTDQVSPTVEQPPAAQVATATETAFVVDTPGATAPAAELPAAPALAEAGDGPLPQLLAEISLAPEGETLHDMRVDRAANRLFVTDSADQLHVLDATTYEPLAVLPYGGWLELDSEHGRLYVYKPFITQEASVIHVIDTTTLESVGALEGRALAIDAQNNRLFVGEPYVVSTADDAPGVRIVDGATLQQTGVFTQAGAPTYNPLRRELLIAAYTVYTADPETQQVTADLFPELTDVGEDSVLWCNGCPWVDGIRFFPAEQLVAVEISNHCAGKGCGTQDAPRFFDAATMQPLDGSTAPQMQADCGSQASLVATVDGRRYVNMIYDRYVVYTNLLVTDSEGVPQEQRDGLRIDYANPRTGQGYLYDGTVLDLATLAPIGRWPAACLMAEDAESGLLFGNRGGSLYIIADRGGQPQPAPGPAPERMSNEWPVRQIAVSPNYAIDNTLLVVTGEGIYRSTDSGEQWRRLRGGLPEGQGSNWSVAFSPSYRSDRTIFAGGDRGEYWGEGIWRSTNGGESWQAQWADLQHRRISAFYLAPDFAADQTVVVQAKFYDVATGESGDSYQQSTDSGLSWTLVATGSLTSSGPDALPPISELVPGYAPAAALPARFTDLHNGLQVTLDGARWITVPLALPEGEWFYDLQPNPRYPDDPTLYAFGHLSLWRSSDNGATWSAWDDGRLNGLDYTNQMHTAAVSPVAADGGYRLFVGTSNGQVWMLDPEHMTWGVPVAAGPQAAAPAVQPTSTAATAATPVPAASPSPVSALPTPTPALTVTAQMASEEEITSTLAVTPSGMATAPVSVASTPDWTPTPVVTAEPLAGDPPEGLFRPQGSLGIVWEANPRIQQDLGWARQATPNVVGGAYQQFDNGVMAWREDTQQIYAFLDNGVWYSFADTFEEGDPESDPRFAPPAGKQQPIRGFGKVWRENPGLREQLGWALAKEQAQQAEVHSFERGVMLRYGGLLYSVVGVDTDNGRWY
jgi:hypothetical protein